MRMLVSICFFLIAELAHVESFLQYQDFIPNGRNVPHSCIKNYYWHGVGHQSFKGGGPVNRFGRDFLKFHKDWKKLCKIDSDGDGRTNGEELGDPDCKWKKNQIPERTVKITNPGVCEPLDTPACKGRNYFLNCEKKFEQCQGLNKEGIKNITIRMPETKVPTQKTTYVRTYVELPQDGDYHLVAVKPYIDTPGLVHHIDIYGCDKYNGAINQPLNKPHFQRTWPRCSNQISGWTIGFKGTCFPEEYGVRFGAKRGYKIVLLEVHWNNHDQIQNLTDSSGLTLFYTEQLRKHDAGFLMIGQIDINIPPLRKSVTVTGVCESSCTKSKMNGPIYIFALSHHMHFNGIAAKTELFRNGSKVVDLFIEEHYYYDIHNMHRPKNPIQMLPGDELKLTCLYTTEYQKTAKTYGLGTDKEMCFGFIQFYPIENSPLSRCLASQNGQLCIY